MKILLQLSEPITFNDAADLQELLGSGAYLEVTKSVLTIQPKQMGLLKVECVMARAQMNSKINPENPYLKAMRQGDFYYGITKLLKRKPKRTTFARVSEPPKHLDCIAKDKIRKAVDIKVKKWYKSLDCISTDSYKVSTEEIKP